MNYLAIYVKNNIGDYMKNNEIIKKAFIKTNPKKRYFYNCLMSFIFGGSISLIGQLFLTLYQNIFGLDDKVSATLMSMSMIVIASFLTAIGIFDKVGQIAGAGTYLPITGFANSMTSSAIESKSEGLIFGILSNMLKLAGTVIVSGVLSSFIVSSIWYIIKLIW